MKLNINDLKSKFENGDIPTEQDFTNLIDSCYNNSGSTPSNNVINIHGFDLLKPETIGVIQFDNNSRTFQISNNPNETYFSFYSNNNYYEKTVDTVVIPNITGNYHIYFDGDGNLQYIDETSITNDIYNDIFYKYAIVVSIYWNSILVSGFVGDNRHGFRMCDRNKEYNHNTFGARYESGIDISGLTQNSNTYSNISSGYYWDEDIRHSIPSLSQHLHVFRLGTADNEWYFTPFTNEIGYKQISNTYYVYNNFDSGQWNLTELSPGKYMNIYFIATNEYTGGAKVIKILGLNSYNSSIDARRMVNDEILELYKNAAGLLSPEFLFLYTLVINEKGIVQKINNKLYQDLRQTKSITFDSLNIVKLPYNGNIEVTIKSDGSGDFLDFVDFQNWINLSVFSPNTTIILHVPDPNYDFEINNNYLLKLTDKSLNLRIEGTYNSTIVNLSSSNPSNYKGLFSLLNSSLSVYNIHFIDNRNYQNFYFINSVSSIIDLQHIKFENGGYMTFGYNSIIRTYNIEFINMNPSYRHILSVHNASVGTFGGNFNVTSIYSTDILTSNDGSNVIFKNIDMNINNSKKTFRARAKSVIQFADHSDNIILNSTETMFNISDNGNIILDIEPIQSGTTNPISSTKYSIQPNILDNNLGIINKMFLSHMSFNGNNGTTTNRPIGISTGYQYFDTDINKPIWWNGSNWVDSNGANV